jgi:hypothetical protein
MTGNRANFGVRQTHRRFVANDQLWLANRSRAPARPGLPRQHEKVALFGTIWHYFGHDSKGRYIELRDAGVDASRAHSRLSLRERNTFRGAKVDYGVLSAQRVI